MAKKGRRAGKRPGKVEVSGYGRERNGRPEQVRDYTQRRMMNGPEPQSFAPLNRSRPRADESVADFWYRMGRENPRHEGESYNAWSERLRGEFLDGFLETDPPGSVDEIEERINEGLAQADQEDPDEPDEPRHQVRAQPIGGYEDRVAYWVEKGRADPRREGESFADWEQRLWDDFGDDFFDEHYHAGDDASFEDVRQDVDAGLGRADEADRKFRWEVFSDSADSYPEIESDQGGRAHMHIHVEGPMGAGDKWSWRARGPTEVFAPEGSGEGFDTMDEARRDAEEWMEGVAYRAHSKVTEFREH